MAVAARAWSKGLAALLATAMLVAMAGELAAPLTARGARPVRPLFGPRREVATMAPGGSALELNDADFNGDSRRDVLVARGRWASTNEYPISVLLNNGHSGFSDRARTMFGGTVPTAQWPRASLLADFNGDRRPDVFIGDSGVDVSPWPGHLNYLGLSQRGGTWRDARASLPPEVAYFHDGTVADVEGDGDRDLFLGDLGTPIRLLLNDGAGSFTTATGRFPASVVAGGRNRFTSSLFSDLNGDGAPDLVLGSDAGNGPSAVLINNRHGYFRELPGALPPKPWGDHDIAITISAARLNHDRFPDLLIGHTKSDPWYRGRWIQVLINDGHGRFRDQTSTRFPRQSPSNLDDWPYKLVTGDLNRDGAPDFAVDLGSQFCCPGRRLVPPFYLNDRHGRFTKLPSRSFKQPPYAQLRLIDVNGDGLLDVFSVWQGLMDAPEHYAVSLQIRRRGSGRP